MAGAGRESRRLTAGGGAPPEPRAGPAGPYVCPMHPEVRQSGPGRCPKCGMRLRPERNAKQREEHAPDHPAMLRDMRAPWLWTNTSVILLGLWLISSPWRRPEGDNPGACKACGLEMDSIALPMALHGRT